jgi:hypothetical protein
VLPINSDWAPTRSIYNKNEYGHSNLRNVLLESNYQVSREHIDVTQTNLDENTLLVIISPELTYTQEEIEYLLESLDDGSYILLLGGSQIVNKISSELNYPIRSIIGPIYDNESNAENNPSYPTFTAQEDEYISVIPRAVIVTDTQNSDQQVFTTHNSSTSRVCIEEGESCNQSYTIGIADRSKNFALIADDWLLSNKFLGKFSQNENLLPNIINFINPDITQIIFDESHYKWAPLNKEGVEAIATNFLDYFEGIEEVISIILISFFLIPLFISTSSGIFSDFTMFSGKEKISKRIGQRIKMLYLDDVPAVPLSLEEQFLIEEQLEMKHRGSKYFQYLAEKMFAYLAEEDILKQIPYELLQGLERMRIDVIPNNQAWQIIHKLNQTIDEAHKELSFTLEKNKMEEIK